MDALTQAQKDGVVIGLKSVAGVKPRLDIDEMLLTQPDTFNLFILALDELVREPPGDKMDFYEVAGIHGLPRKYWDGVQNTSKNPNGTWSGEGYCAHSVIQFPTWHRPYISMLEQTVYARMSVIVDRFPKSVQAKYSAALQDFRFPYWDYYRPRGRNASFPGVRLGAGRTSFSYDYSLPQILSVEQVVIRRTKDDQLDLIDNPFYKFAYPRQGGFSSQDWNLANQQLIQRTGRTYSNIRTYRHPVNAPTVNDNFSEMNSVLNSQREPENRIIMSMIGDDIYSDYETFATASDDPNAPASGSLEDIHGQYHVLVGGTAGHMSTVPLAAFDPVFWLHHCQIDRWFAIWQARHPNNWFHTPGASQASLLPFRKSKDASGTKFWNSDDSRRTDTFGYVYKDALNSPDDTLANFRRKYQWAIRSARTPFGTPPADMEPLDLKAAQVFRYSDIQSNFTLMAATVGQAPQVIMEAAASTASAIKEAVATSDAKSPLEGASQTKDAPTAPVAFKKMASNNPQIKLAPSNVDELKYARSWYVDNKVERLALNGSFSIYFFIGNFDKQSPQHYMTQPTMAAINYIFTASAQACDNCGVQAEQGNKVTGTNDITPMLLDYIELGQIPDLAPANVVPFLVKNLKWRVVTSDGIEVNPREVRGLQIGVSCKLSPEPPTTGGPLYEEHPEVIEEIIRNSS